MSWSHAAIAYGFGPFCVFCAAMIVVSELRKRRRIPPPPSNPVVDYSEARKRAIARLGDRYLLARPINRRAPRS
jgi:hypothetical protein